MTTHIFYFLFRSYIGYGDVLLISALSFVFPLQFTIYVIIFTFVIAGLVALITMIFKPIKLLPLVPFIFISFSINSLFIMISINFQEAYILKIKEMVTSEMPRERLLSHGAKSLSNTELLAILINTGRKGFSSIDISNELLKSASNLNELKKSSINDLIQVKGIGLQKAITLKAAFELGERMGRRAENNRIKITQPSDVADYMIPTMKDLTQEHFVILLLNSKNVVIKETCVFKGTLNSSNCTST